MGHQSLMLVLLASLLVGLGTFTFMDSWDSSTRTTTSQFMQEQALNVSHAGVNLAISKLRLDKTWRTGFNSFAVANGRCTLTVTDIGLDSVRLVSSGVYSSGRRDSAVHRSVVRAKLTSIFPVVESALTVYGDSVIFSNAGKSFSIDGHDYLSNGTTLGTHSSVYGMGVYTQKIADGVKKTIVDGGVSDNVDGKGTKPSVGLFTNKDLITELRDMYKDLRTITLPAGKYSGNATFGTLTNPEIVYVSGDLDWTGKIAGSGILVVDGDLIMKGTVEWKGIIIALSADIDLYLGGSGTPNLLGTTFVGTSTPGKITKVRINGNPYIRYSYEVLQNILARLNLLQVEILSWYE
jgi:hypothetical protein